MAIKPFPYTLIDLSHSLSGFIPSWEGDCGFQHQTVLDYDDSDSEIGFRVQRLIMDAGIGTHIDAPAHCVKGGKTIADLDLDQLLAPCVVIDVSTKATENTQITAKDISYFEMNYGKIQEHSFVILRTGWEKYWVDRDKYRNNYIFPYVAQDAADMLLQRNAVGLGVDTLSPDRPDAGYNVHKTFLGAGKYIVENVANAGCLLPLGSYILILPIKVEEGTEAPVRLVALVEKGLV
ncbi:metal-dependent hydrolase [Legionella lansingensis]|uniref:Metal-dependent hydrolase n=1 Tax=Legionella lansingensis TaxID=45067 RepID=A0A0W0VZI9_9GAMM|nr:cyclase family protein [Legionella lansingensis]KTD25716.1 metal-dependent hydrolase [Legionella lansingensis]SNV49241.1 metal-dependent hydrolase [Legionella lansingensis]